jgi:hypothetical protein
MCGFHLIGCLGGDDTLIFVLRRDPIQAMITDLMI